MEPRLLAALGALLAVQKLVAAGDYTLLEQLPDRLHAPIANASDATASTPEQRLAFQRRYNKILLDMIADMSNAYHGKHALSRKNISAYAQQLDAAFRSRQHAIHPASRSTSESELQIANEVHRELLMTIEQMVVAITKGDSRFDWQHWKRRWNRA